MFNRITKFIIILIVVNFQYKIYLVSCLIDNDKISGDIDFNNSDVDINNTGIHNNVGNNKNNNNTDHICYREEMIIEQIKIPIKQSVRVRSSNWCLEFPPRCSNYKTEIRETIKVQNVTRKKFMEYCCEGYAKVSSDNQELICKPICKGGCGKGFCHAPNECICDVGYIGRHCSQRCRLGLWGKNCEKVCKCRNDSICNSVTGECQCQEGWIGELCNQPCPNGFYGLNCKNTCECSSNRCNSKTGECIVEEIITKLKPINRPSSLPNFSTTESIVQTTEISFKKLDKEVNPENSTNLIIKTLNSTIANLTENIDKLAKNLNKQTETVTLIVPETIVEITTPSPKTVSDVIVIKPAESSKPAVIIHHPSVTTTTTTTTEANKSETSNSIVPTTVAKTPEIIHVITNLQQPIQEMNSNETKHDIYQSHNDHDWTAVVAIIFIFITLIILSTIGLAILYRKHLKNQEQTNPGTPQIDTNQEAKICTKPLPDLPAFTQNLTKTVVIPEVYDRPKNNSTVPRQSLHPYSYATANGTVYSLTTKCCDRKHSLEHLYDEIKYPSVHSTTSRL